MEEIRRGDLGASGECRRASFSIQRRCAKIPVLACFCFILSIGALRWSAVDALSLKGTEAEGWLDRRQRRSPSGGDAALSSLLNPASNAGEVDAESISELLRESPWALVAFRDYPGGRRHTVSFTPRLGRDSGEEEGEEETLVKEEEEEEEAEEDEETMRSYGKRRTPPFAPRLGRRTPARRGVIPFIPRMGRRQLRGNARADDAPSHSSGNSDRHYLFSPRLGRRASSSSEGSSQPGGVGATAPEDGGAKEA